MLIEVTIEDFVSMICGMDPKYEIINELKKQKIGGIYVNR